jgi:multisubunit Na+/H+ antiporter MnhG subunit
MESILASTQVPRRNNLRRRRLDQLHAAGLITGPALILMLLAALASGSAEIFTSAARVLVLLLVTSSLSGHAIAQAARRRPAPHRRHPAQRRLEAVRA